jgi:hypothetical protein
MQDASEEEAGTTPVPLFGRRFDILIRSPDPSSASFDPLE